MDSSLKEYLRATEGDGLVYLFEYLIFAEKIGIMAVCIPVKGAELALIDTDIGVIDIPVNDKGNNAL